MLIVLPFFFAVGFGVGYFWDELEEFFHSRIWTWVAEIPQAIDGALPNLLNWFAPALTILVVGVTFGLFALPPVITIERLLELATIVVGALAARWFVDRRGSRDQLAFLGGASAFLFLAALEYDHKLFGNLSKIGGSEFSVEFSDEGRAGRSNSQSPVQSTSGTGDDFLNGAFPGGSGTNSAVGYLASLPGTMVRDEKYANLLSAPSGSAGHAAKELQPEKLVGEMPVPTQRLLAYICTRVAPVSQQLRVLQDFYHSDTSVLAVDPHLVAALRREYSLARWSELNDLERDGALTAR